MEWQGLEGTAGGQSGPTPWPGRTTQSQGLSTTSTWFLYHPPSELCQDFPKSPKSDPAQRAREECAGNKKKLLCLCFPSTCRRQKRSPITLFHSCSSWDTQGRTGTWTVSPSCHQCSSTRLVCTSSISLSASICSSSTSPGDCRVPTSTRIPVTLPVFQLENISSLGVKLVTEMHNKTKPCHMDACISDFCSLLQQEQWIPLSARAIYTSLLLHATATYIFGSLLLSIPLFQNHVKFHLLTLVFSCCLVLL